MSNQLSSVYIAENSTYLATENSQISLDTPEFYQWLEANDSFRFEAGENSYRARKDKLPTGVYWYAYKKVSGKLHKRYIGKTEEVNYTRLLEVAQSIRQPPSRQPKPKQATQSRDSNPNAALEVLQAEVIELRETVRQNQQLLEYLSSKVAELESRNTDVTQQNTPDYHAIANAVLSDLKLGKQSQAGKALNLFIKQIQKVETI